MDPAGHRHSAARAPLRVAIACTGVGQVKRGFERYFADLHRVLSERIDITLFKGGGPDGPKERRIPLISRVGRLQRVLPLHRLIGRTPYHVECLTFVLGLYPRVRLGGFDVVHCIDPPVARLMFWMRRALGGRFRLLYTEGCAMPPGDCPPADHVHHVAMQPWLDAQAHGYAAEDMTLVPCGIDAARFDVAGTREALRREHGVAQDAFVILSVAAINRDHKRTDHLVAEVARLSGGRDLLWLDGSFDHGEPALLEEARRALGERLRYTHVPSERVGELYRLADVMVLASLHESFALVVAEALSAGTPVLAHDNAHFRWLVGEEDALVDMREPGALAARLERLRGEARDPAALAAMAARARERFDWRSLAPLYVELYEKASALERRDYRLRARAQPRPCPASSSASRP